MPSYTVTNPSTGQKLTLTGDGPPTEKDLDEIFAKTSASSPPPTKKNGKPVWDAEGVSFGTAKPVDTRKVSYTDQKARPEQTAANRKTLSSMARPLLEAGGAVGGGLLGSAAPGPGNVAGAGIGYAIGKNFADQLEGDTPQSLPEAGIRTLNDIATGGTMEMGGQLLAAGGGYALNKGGQLLSALRRNTPAITEGGLNAKAGQILANNTGEGAVYARNADEAAKLNVPGYQPSIGEARNDPGLIKLQRGIERQPGTAANIILEKKAANQAAVKDYLQNEFTGNESIDDVINALNQRKAQIEGTTKASEQVAGNAKNALNPADPQTIGRNITDTVDTALAPVKTAEREAWSQVPNYPIPANNFTAAADALKKTPMVKSTESAVNEIIDFAGRMPKTTEGLQSIERTINDKMYAVNADPNVKRVLGSLKKALNDDFAAMSAASESGDVALHNGEIVYPSKLQAEKESLTKRLTDLTAKSEPDYAAMQKALREKGVSPAMFEQMDKYDTGWQKRTIDQYTKKISQYTPEQTTLKTGELDNIKKSIAAIDDKLANLSPAEDIAAAYRSAKDVSKERFDRFGKGALADITRQGNQANGLKIPDSAIPAKVFSMDGAESFIRAVGKEAAATHADQYAAQDLLAKANPVTGELSTKAISTWLQKNMGVLRKYGISGKYANVAKAQATVEAARGAEGEFAKSAASRILNADVDKAIASAFSSNPNNTAGVADDLLKQIGTDPAGKKGLQNAFKDFIVSKVETTAKTIEGDAIISPAAIQKTLVKYAPAMRKLYANDPSKIAALNKVSKAVEIQSRSAKSPIGGGSDTAENINMAHSILGKIVDTIPGLNFTAKLGRMGLSKLNEMNANELNKVIARALYDPELAQTLMLAAKRYSPEVVAKRLNSQLMTAGIIGVKNAVQ